ncbi:MAG: DUF1343 domain-containing protein [Odoribacter splanchnicus]|nr:DUF1343 domain-containing protein [Odoribacter splanchnicus]
MKGLEWILLSLLMVWSVGKGVAQNGVSPGVEDYGMYRAKIEGKRVGVVANQTAVVPELNMMHTVDFLRERGVNVVKIFCPEHGFRGDADAGEQVGDYRDKVTGLPVISLYGKKKKPLPDDLKDIDVLIFDMQDVGVRFYTYISTLHYVMEACAENDIPLIVTDRPNPNAFYVDGPVLDLKHRSFVGMHPVPVVYGMTIGEYARMVNGEGWLQGGEKCRLTVVACRNWERDMTVELPCKPSPNLPDKVSVMLYPSTCLFEGTVVSEGRGTTVPFQVFGHPELKNMPYSFTPRSIEGMSKSPKCLGKVCYGMNLSGCYEEVKKGRKLRLDWLLLAYRNYTGKEPFFTSFFEKLAGTEQLRKDIIAGKEEDQIRASWQKELETFKQIRKKYLIY